MSENKSLKDINLISTDLVSKFGVQALTDTPNRKSRYGEAGLSSQELKAHFDKVPTKLIEKVNEIIAALKDENLSANINVKLSDEETKTLAELGASIVSGALAEILQVGVGTEIKSLDEWAAEFLNKLDKKALVHYLSYNYPNAFELTNEGAAENGKLTADRPYTVFGVDNISLCKYRPREGEDGYNAEDVTGTVAALGTTGFKKLYDVDGARGKGLMTVTEKGIHFELLKREGNTVSRDITLGELLFPLDELFLEKSLTISTKEQSDKDYLHKTASGTEDVAVVKVDEVGNTFAETLFDEPRANAIVKRDKNGNVLVPHNSGNCYPAINEQRAKEIVSDDIAYFQEASLPNILSSYALKAEISRVYRPCGSVPTYADLPAPEHLDEGDVYSVDAAYGNYPADTNYVWLGDRWDALGGTIDLSGYLPKSGGVITGNLDIEGGTLRCIGNNSPGFRVLSRTSGREALVKSTKSGSSELRNQLDGANFSLIQLRPETDSLENLVGLTLAKNGSARYFRLYGSHNLDLSLFVSTERFEEAMGDIDTALDELHTYAQALVNGGNA